MEIFNNTTKVVKDDLEKTIRQGSRVSIAAACFSIYAYQELKSQLEDCKELRFIFTSPTFVAEKTQKERREFYIPRLKREKSLYGTEFEVRLRNELKQKAVAKECAEWMRRKVRFKTNTTREGMNNFLLVDGAEDAYTYMPMNTFTTVDLGCERGNNLTNMVTRIENPASAEFLRMFDSVWSDEDKLTDVTEEVIDMISTVYQENAPELVYFMTIYNIFSEFWRIFQRMFFQMRLQALRTALFGTSCSTFRKMPPLLLSINWNNTTAAFLRTALALARLSQRLPLSNTTRVAIRMSSFSARKSCLRTG